MFGTKEKIKKINGAIIAPLGFEAAGIRTGVKRRRKDLALIYTKNAAISAGVYTTNVVKAAPLLVTKDIVEKGTPINAIIINSGNANACTGAKGLTNAWEMIEKTQKVFNLPQRSVLVASTGVIGVQLQMDKILDGIEEIATQIGNNEQAALNAAEGIMTTDTFVKGIAYEFEISGKTVKIGAIAKGSGMIHPNMGTMLGFVTTDAVISKEMLQKALSDSTKNTYNMISVDGDTSTNDMVLVLANGCAKNKPIESETDDYKTFAQALDMVNKHLAKQIVLDGEGATKFLEINVFGAKDENSAKILAKSVITSNLVKTAFFGEDANWGRILAALGYSGVKFDPEKVSIEFNSGDKSLYLMENGTPLEFCEETAHEILKNKEITVNVYLNEGNSEATAWGCDLSYEYVRINGEYRT